MEVHSVTFFRFARRTVQNLSNRITLVALWLLTASVAPSLEKSIAAYGIVPPSVGGENNPAGEGCVSLPCALYSNYSITLVLLLSMAYKTVYATKTSIILT